MLVSELTPERASLVKRAFTIRRVPLEDMRTLLVDSGRPTPGDLVLARVDRIGKQTRLELTDGRRAIMFPGDEIAVAYGNRYAVDQYEALIGDDLSPCDLVAAGGVAACELTRHRRMRPPTSISPYGLIGDANGKRLNLRDYAIAPGDSAGPITAVLVAGTSMNAGKTLTSASIVRGLKAAGYRVGAIKATGTGSGGDMWIMHDVGADIVVDFTDAGCASTYKMPVSEIEELTFRLISYCSSFECDFAIIEIADGLQQEETAALLASKRLRLACAGVVFAACDPMGAISGVTTLTELGHLVLALSGKLTQAPLAIREAEHALDVGVYTPMQLQEGALVHKLEGAVGCKHGSLAKKSQSARVRPWLVHSVAAMHQMQPGPVRSGEVGDLLPARTAIASSVPIVQSRPADDGRHRQLLGLVTQRLMRLEVDALCRTSCSTSNTDRNNSRKGYRLRRVETALGPINLKIPRLRKGNYFPTFLVRNSAKLKASTERALIEFVANATSKDVSAASMNELTRAIGIAGLPEYELSTLCQDINQRKGSPLLQQAGRANWPISNGANGNANAGQHEDHLLRTDVFAIPNDSDDDIDDEFIDDGEGDFDEYDDSGIYRIAAAER